MEALGLEVLCILSGSPFQRQLQWVPRPHSLQGHLALALGILFLSVTRSLLKSPERLEGGILQVLALAALITLFTALPGALLRHHAPPRAQAHQRMLGPDPFPSAGLMHPTNYSSVRPGSPPDPSNPSYPELNSLSSPRISSSPAWSWEITPPSLGS